jgi:16S rRNA (guanine966-N2)-methyltransferase
LPYKSLKRDLSLVLSLLRGLKDVYMRPMRIISGTHRGRKLDCPRGLSVRPTPERVREALFSMLAHRIHGAVFLDLFSGTGAVGLEALSRGAGKVIFVEHDRQHSRVLQKNRTLFDEQRSELLGLSCEHALGRLQPDLCDLIFLDPPYGKDLLEPTLQEIMKAKALKCDGLIMCEHPSRHRAPTPPAALTVVETRQWGDVAISFLEFNAKAV